MKITNCILKGKIPQELYPILFGANLIAFNKQGGGIRPIAVGGVFRRVAAKCAVSTVREQAATISSPLQLGCGVRGGIDIAIHAARTAVETAAANQVMLKVDFTNAFNTVRRDHMFESVVRHLPSLAPFVSACYCSHSFLCIGDSKILSAEGLQQGDPLAPILFCIAIHDLLASLSSRVIIAYLDDVTLIGDTGDVESDFALIQAAAETTGLHCNAKKCEVVPLGDSPMTTDLQDRFPGVAPVCVNNLSLLGASLGPSSLIQILSAHLEQFQRFRDNLGKLRSHDAFYLLKNCLGIPKLSFALRTSPCFLLPDTLTTIDKSIQEALSEILNVRCVATEWKQASLPTKFGGLGIPSIATIATSAFLSSFQASKELAQQIINSTPSNSASILAVEAWTASTEKDLPVSSQQSAWTQPIFEGQFKSLVDQADVTGKARLLGCSSRGASAWLSALPSGTMGLRLTNEQLRIAICLRLGSRVFSTHQCVCGAQSDSQGNHALSCNHTKSRHARHHQLNDILSRALNSAMMPNRLEPTGLARTDNRRPDGVTLVPWIRGRLLAWDASCIHRLALTWVGPSSFEGTPAADQAELRKRKKYAAIEEDSIFEPFVVETLGGIGVTSYKFLRQIAERVKASTGESRAFPFLLQRVGITIQRWNAGCILECVHAGSDFIAL